MRQLGPDLGRLENLEAGRRPRGGARLVDQVQLVERAPELVVDAVLAELQLGHEVSSEASLLLLTSTFLSKYFMLTLFWSSDRWKLASKLGDQFSPSYLCFDSRRTSNFSWILFLRIGITMPPCASNPLMISSCLAP